MPHFQQLGQFLQRLSTREPQLENSDDAPAKDAELREVPTERYAAWSASAIYGFAPFQSPMGR
jgi:hypothetical protein